MTFITLEGLRRFWRNVSQRATAIYTAASSDGVSYTVTVPGVTELKHGMRITISPARMSASASPTLNVNGLGAHFQQRRCRHAEHRNLLLCGQAASADVRCDLCRRRLESDGEALRICAGPLRDCADRERRHWS